MRVSPNEVIPDEYNAGGTIYFAKDENFVEVGHGGSNQFLSVTGSEVNKNGEAAVTVQYFADISKTIKSHVYKYVMKKIDDEWVFVSSEMTKTGKYEPMGYSI